MLFTKRACVRRQAMNFQLYRTQSLKMRYRLTNEIHFRWNRSQWNNIHAQTHALLEMPHVCNRSELVTCLFRFRSLTQHIFSTTTCTEKKICRLVFVPDIMLARIRDNQFNWRLLFCVRFLSLSLAFLEMLPGALDLDCGMWWCLAFNL